MALPNQVSPPEVALSSVAPTGVLGAEVVALPVVLDEDGPTLGPGSAELLDELDLDVFALLEHHKATGKAGEVVEHAVLSIEGLSNDSLRSLLFVGVGKGSPADLRRAGAALARRTRGKKVVATSLAALSDDAGLRALVEGLVLGSFGFHRRSQGPKESPVGRVVLAGISGSTDRQPTLERALSVAGAGWMSRTLALVPSNEKNPIWMAERATEIADAAGLKIKVWDEKELAAGGFGGIIGVGQASVNPPRLIRLDYTPRGAGRNTPHVVLVGKGITFDTGGLSIKPADGMMNMKRDMTGGGVVMAVLGALSDVDCPVRVTGLVAAAENAIGGNALRPGDVIRHYGGRTSEVRNTDAEGRLVMADALAYAVSEIKPDALVDVATLTGAMKISLGQRTGGFFATDDALADLIATAGAAAGEPLWRMPLVEDYEERLESKVADADNAAGGPGAITAALFLRHFTGGLPWAHLDIASVGDSPVDAYEWTMGATGFGARALLHWLELR
ncbi:MAG TPA: leucyl aminopeptidase, partial [Nocardioidaceae bacterium]|nr:leucyl aminopeptidase [Nocardioidaceae bacterium]